MNARTGSVVATAVELADTRAARNRGLLGRDGMEPASALILLPCFSVHTMFMRFPIDVVFVDRDGVVVRVVTDLPPWRMAASFRAHAVIEMMAGSVLYRDILPGDRLYLAANPTPSGAAVSWPIPA